MPLPTPSYRQTRKEFIAACMKSEVIQGEFPKQKQALAVCFSRWRGSKARKTAKATRRARRR